LVGPAVVADIAVPAAAAALMSSLLLRIKPCAQWMDLQQSLELDGGPLLQL
jgi:hypothetical protein